MRKALKKYFSKWKLIDVIILILSICSIVFVTYFPLLYAYVSMPKGFVFSGEASFFEPVDTNLYVSAIHYGQWGGILLPNLYTSIPNTPVLIYPFLTTLGFIFRFVNPFLLFYVAGLLTEIFLIFGLVFVINKLRFSIKMSLYSIVLICLGGGFGFVNFPNIIPADMTYLHPTFFVTLQKSHEAIAIFCFILALVNFYFYILEKRRLKTKQVLSILIPLLISVFIYPFFAISFFLITGMYLLIQRKLSPSRQDIFIYVGLMVCSAIIIGVLLVQFIINPTFLGISAHIGVDILSEILGFGILFPIFIFQLFWLPRSPLKTFLSIWFIVIFMLAILPIGPGSVFLRGSFFPIVLLGILVIKRILSRATLFARVAIIFLFFILLTATSLRIFFMRMTYDYTANPYIYIPAEQYGIFSYLNGHAAPKSVVLALYMTGNEIPALTHNVVYMGHGLQTPDAQRKLQEEQSFYTGNESVADARKFLLDNNISFVLWGIEEKSFYQTHAKLENHLKEIFSQLKMVYVRNGIAVLAVDKEKLNGSL